MDVTVQRSDLLRELRLIQPVVERKNTIPILANVLLRAEAGKSSSVMFSATDLEVALIGSCAAEIATPGEMTLPARRLYDIVKALSDGPVRLSSTAKDGKLDAGGYSARLQTLPREDFPVLSEPKPDAVTIALPKATFKGLIGRVAFAITHEDTRYFLHGSLLVLKDGRMALVSTDGHRLALASAACPEVPVDISNVIIPAKTLTEFDQLLSEDSGGDTTIHYTRGDNHLFFQIGSHTLISRVIDANFPAYERVIPKGNDKRVEVNRAQLASAIKRVQLMSHERSHSVTFAFKAGEVEMSARSAESGEATESIPVEWTHEPVSVCFNASYVLDFLGAADTEQIAFELKDEITQAIVRPVGETDYSYLYVLMPMRI